MICMPAWRYGAALSLTAGVLYIACAIVAMLVPDAIARALTTVVHGLNIGGLTSQVPSTSIDAVGMGLVYVTVYAFVAGWLFGVVHNSLARGRSR
ncbi:MAG: DUF5676 family membrane protein [Pseudomonadota bacterium]